MTDYAARIRAARAYAGMHQAQLAERLGVDVQTIKRREKPGAQPRPGELEAIARACEVPVEFMHDGFGVEPSALSERLQAIEDAVTATDARSAVTDLRAYIERALHERTLRAERIVRRLHDIEDNQRTMMEANETLIELARQMIPDDAALRDALGQAAESATPSPASAPSETELPPDASQNPPANG